MALCGCTDKLFPLKDNELNDVKPLEFTVYVCGAVQNEGYFTVPSGSDCFAAINLAGLTDASVLPAYADKLVDGTVTEIVVGYYCDGVRRDCVNVNGALVQNRIPVDGIDPTVINKIADYIDEFGKITDKTLLADILGDDYADNFYRFFVAREDYEKVG